MLLLSCPVQWCGSCLTHPTAVLASTAARVVHCCLSGLVLWCGCGCLSVLLVWWGILCLLPPHSGGGWGHRGWWGGIADGGWHGEGRAAVLLTPRLVCGVPRLCAGVPPCRLPCGPIEWREWCVLCRPRVRVGSGTLRCSAPLHVVRSPRIVLVLLLSCVAVFVVGGEVWWRVSRAA